MVVIAFLNHLDTDLQHKKILSGDVYEPETIEFLIADFNDGDVVHAGTYFGDFLPALSKSRKTGAKIWAFEPNPENYRCAKITVAINGLQNVELQNAALGDSECSLNMTTKDSSGIALGGASRILLNSARKDLDKGLTTVGCVSIDAVIPQDRNISIIQLDVEGFEKQALSGALDTIRRCRPIIVIENLPEKSWFDQNILHLGYRESQQVHDNTIFMPDNL